VPAAWERGRFGHSMTLKDELAPLIEQGLAAAIYTQLADVEIEVNGYLTYDRAMPKMDEQRIIKAHRALCRALG